MHTYSVALRISGTDLDVDQVSAKLRQEATQTRVIGQPLPDGKVWTESLWQYEVRPDDAVVWDSLEDGLRTLLSAFAANLREIMSALC